MDRAASRLGGYPRIAKAPGAFAVVPNLTDYAAVRRDFSWAAARALLDGLPGGKGLNIAHEAVDRHAVGARADRQALRWLGRNGALRTFSYRELRAATNRFANALRSLGVAEGDRVFVLSGRIPELYIAALGALKAKRVVSPLFSAFGPEPLQTRLGIGEGRCAGAPRVAAVMRVLAKAKANRENSITLYAYISWI
jgi:acetyl-CoA synthetase